MAPGAGEDQRRFRELLEERGLGHWAEAILAAATPSIRLRARPLGDRPPPSGVHVSPFREFPEPMLVEGVESAVAVAAGASHGLALLEDGAVVAWGDNFEGQLGDGSRDDRSLPLPVHRLGGVVAISAGGHHNLAILADGRVLAWGSNQNGVLGDGSTTRRRLKPVAVAGIEGEVVAAAAGGSHSLALTADGRVWSWGWNRQGQLADGGPVDEWGAPLLSQRNVPAPVVGLSGPADRIAAGVYHSLARLADGRVFGWGNVRGRLDSSPQEIAELRHATCLDGGTLISVGLLPDGSVARADTAVVRVVPTVAASMAITMVRVGHERVLALRQDGAVVALDPAGVWSDPLVGLEHGQVAMAAGGNSFMPNNLAVADDGRVRWWGRIHAPPQPEAPLDLPVGMTKLGGRPDLPPGTEWPRKGDVPLSFVGQIRLDEVHDLEGTQLLPSSGLLTFFYDADQLATGYEPGDAGAGRVLFSPSQELLAAADFPDDLVLTARFPPVALALEPELTLPSLASLAFEEMGLAPQDEEAYWELEMWLDETDPVHRLLGHEQPVQHGAVQPVVCQLVSNGIDFLHDGHLTDARTIELLPGAGDWRLLLQVDSDDAAGIMWGDAGRVHFWIRRDDLETRKFDAVWVICQSH